jgi:hypothetical protein
MRSDFEVAERTYKSNLDEQNRLYARGGSSAPTKRLKDTSAGTYLALVTKSLQTLKKNRWRTVGMSTVLGLSRVGWSESVLRLTVCEDSAAVRILDRTGRDVTPAGDRRFVQSVTVRKVDHVWKIVEVDTHRVPTFENQACG